MPNYVTNNLYIDASGDKLQEILESIRADGGELGSFDFNKLIPMPDTLNITAGSQTDDAISVYLAYLRNRSDDSYPAALTSVSALKTDYWNINYDLTEKEITDMAERYNMSVESLVSAGKQYIENHQQYGAATWYEWRLVHWGTKWNAPEGKLIDEQDPQVIRFDTAWSAPLPVILALSEKFPDVKFGFEWSDEDIGYNVGAMEFKGGDVIKTYAPNPGSKEAYEMAFDIHKTTVSDYFLRYDEESNTYVYDENIAYASLDKMIATAEEKKDALPAAEHGELDKEAER